MTIGFQTVMPKNDLITLKRDNLIICISICEIIYQTVFPGEINIMTFLDGSLTRIEDLNWWPAKIVMKKISSLYHRLHVSSGSRRRFAKLFAALEQFRQSQDDEWSDFIICIVMCEGIIIFMSVPILCFYFSRRRWKRRPSGAADPSTMDSANYFN